MKTSLKVIFAAAALTFLMAVPAFAAETKKEFRAEAAPIREELKETQLKLQTLREENKAYAEKFNAIRLEKKETGSLPIDKADWRAAKELRREIPEARGEFVEGEVKSLRAQAAVAREAGDFNQAIDCLNQALEAKKARLDAAEKVNEIWKEIDEYLK